MTFRLELYHVRRVYTRWMTSISHNQRLNLHFFEPSVGILTLHFKFILPLMSAWGGYLQLPHLDQEVISGYLVPGRQSRENVSAFLKNDLFFLRFQGKKTSASRCDFKLCLFVNTYPFLF